MELTPKQQAIELIRQAKNILVTTHKNPDGDALGALITLKLALEALGKTITAVAPGEIGPAFSYLPMVEKIEKNLTGGSDFLISINTSKLLQKELKLGYKNDKSSQKLTIVITPSDGVIEESDVSFSTNRPKFDLIIVLDSPDMERLSYIFDQFAQTFYETPMINIDHHPGNNHFGKVNWVDLTATSTCEILVALLESLAASQGQTGGPKLLTEDVATALLTGIITDTGSFQNANTTPKSFTVAAQLVAAGAKQQEIIKHIFKTKPLTTLKIWGKVLTNVVEEQNPCFVWSVVSKEDVSEAQAQPSELSGVIDELLKSTPGMDFALLISERPSADGKESVLHGNLRAIGVGVDVSKLGSLLGGGGHTKAAGFEIPRVGTLTSQTADVISQIKKNYPLTNPEINELEMPEIN